MGIIVTLDNNGRIVYDGLLTSKEKATVDEIISTLKTEIPQIEGELAETYGNGILYKYNLGAILGGLLEKYNVSPAERRRFWDEIKNIASQEKRIRNEGKNSATRSFYEQCYQLSLFKQSVVEKLSWRQWQDILDRVGNREDPRLFLWIEQYKEKIREDDWREFEKALHLYLKDKDTSVFDTPELFEIYDSLMMMCRLWREKFKVFASEHPKSAKIKTRGTWAKKYYALCFALKKEIRSRAVTEDICNQAFSELMDK